VHPLLLRETLMDRVFLGAVAIRSVTAKGASDSVAKGVDE
jgi:hypothetical protein